MGRLERAARRRRRQARKDARNELKLERIRGRPARIAKRKARRKKFFRGLGKGLKSVAGGLLCATKAAATSALSDPEVMSGLQQLGSAAAGNPASEAMGMQAVASLAKKVGGSIVDQCVKDNTHKEMAKSMIQVTDYAKYAEIAHNENPTAALKAIIRDTHAKAQETGSDLAEQSGVSPVILKAQNMLVERLEKIGVKLPDSFLKMPIERKLALVQKLTARASQLMA